MEKLRIYAGYGGRPKCEVHIDGVTHVIEIDEVERILTKAIESKGYKVEQTNRQKFPRITIND